MRTFWCNTHQRAALNEHGCAPGLAGILLPCSVVELTGIATISENFICPHCGVPMEAQNTCWMPQCRCWTFTVPIRSDGTAVMPSGKVVRVREEMRK